MSMTTDPVSCAFLVVQKQVHRPSPTTQYPLQKPTSTTHQTSLNVLRNVKLITIKEETSIISKTIPSLGRRHQAITGEEGNSWADPFPCGEGSLSITRSYILQINFLVCMNELFWLFPLFVSHLFNPPRRQHS